MGGKQTLALLGSKVDIRLGMRKHGTVQMKVFLVMVAATACTAPDHGAATGAAGASGELIGYFHYAREFQVYPTEQAVRDRNKGHRQCVSGLFSDAQRHLELSPRLHWKKVRLVGRYAEWKPILEQRIAGDPIVAMAQFLQNECFGKRVFVADDAIPLN